MEFSKPDYWSGELFTSPGELPYLGIELGSPALQADSLPSEPPGNPKALLPPNNPVQGTYSPWGWSPKSQTRLSDSAAAVASLVVFFET